MPVTRRCISSRSEASTSCLLLRVKAGSRFIQDEDRGIFEEGTCQGQALGLPGAQACAFFADHRLIPIRQRLDKLVQVRQAQRRIEFIVRGFRLGQAQVGRNRIVEKKWILGHPGNRLRQASSGISVDGCSLMVNLPVAGFDKTQQQRRQGGFPRPAGADQGDVFPGMDFQREVFKAGSVSPG